MYMATAQLHSLLLVTVTGSNRTMMIAAESEIITAVPLQWRSVDIECDSGETACAATMEGSIANTTHANSGFTQGALTAA